MINTIRRLLGKKPLPRLVTVNLYMKSGNVIVADRVQANFTITDDGSKIIKISDWLQRKPINRVFLLGLQLHQIEAIVIND